MKKYKVIYMEEQARSVIIEAESEEEARDKCDDWLSGDSDEEYAITVEGWYEYRIDEAVAIKTS